MRGFLLFLLSFLILHASDIQELLQAIEQKSDLSQKTKKENWGITYVYTRQDLQKMQARYLKDILLSLFPMQYKINNYGLYDPIGSTPRAPFLSSPIKLFIDNQEISVGMYGSGLVLYGDMDISFADHIEVYIGSPSFEISSEPSLMVIKIYTKSAQRDGGNRLAAFLQNYGGKMSYFHTAEELNSGWSYFGYVSSFNDRYKKVEHLGSSLSRDREAFHTLGTLQKDKKRFLVDIVHKNMDSFVDQSVFATPKQAGIDVDYFHIGYDETKGHLRYNLTYERTQTKTNFLDLYKNAILQINRLYGQNLPYSLDTKSHSDIYTASLQYRYYVDQKSSLQVGGKYRYKHGVYTKLIYNDAQLPSFGNDTQKVASVFAECKYRIGDATIFNFGINHFDVRNNNSNQNDKFTDVRAFLTHLEGDWTFKTIFSYIHFYPDLYMINSIFLNNPTQKLPLQKHQFFTQEIAYTHKRQKYILDLTYITGKNYLLPDSTSPMLLSPYEKTLRYQRALLRFVQEYREFDKFQIGLNINKVFNIPKSSLFKNSSIVQTMASVKNFNTFSWGDLYNEIDYFYDSWRQKHQFHYNMALSLHLSKDLQLKIKGENLFNSSISQEFYVLSPALSLQKLPVQLFDRRFSIGVEYTF